MWCAHVVQGSPEWKGNPTVWRDATRRDHRAVCRNAGGCGEHKLPLLVIWGDRAYGALGHRLSTSSNAAKQPRPLVSRRARLGSICTTLEDRSLAIRHFPRARPTASNAKHSGLSMSTIPQKAIG